MDVEVLMGYIKNLEAYISNLAVTFFGLSWYVEALDQLLENYLDRLCIRTEAYRGRLGQDNIV